jgi:hypothetical protein
MVALACRENGRYPVRVTVAFVEWSVDPADARVGRSGVVERVEFRDEGCEVLIP